MRQRPLARRLALILALVVLCEAVPRGLQFLQHQREERLLAECRENLETLAQGLERYSTDHGAVFPEELAWIARPGYLPPPSVLPRCPSKGFEYAPGYENRLTSRHSAPPLDDDGREDTYTLVCRGDHRALGVPSGYPRSTSARGLELRP